MRYFKIRVGFGSADDRYIAIDETELEAALACFITDSKGVFRNGVCRGRDIISITEDWHRAMGWNQGYVMQAEDWAEIEAKGVGRQYAGLIGEVKAKIQHLIETQQTHLIGKNASVPGFEQRSILPPELLSNVADLAAAKKI